MELQLQAFITVLSLMNPTLLVVGGIAAALRGIQTTHDIITKFHQEGVMVPRWFVTINTLLLLVVAVAALLVVGLA